MHLVLHDFALMFRLLGLLILRSVAGQPANYVSFMVMHNVPYKDMQINASTCILALTEQLPLPVLI